MKNLLFCLTLGLIVAMAACTGGNQPAKEDHAKQEMHEEGEQVARTAITVDPQMLATADDVVCGMSMKSTPISDTAVVNGKVYPFCSSGCKKAFMADMSKYKVN